MSKVLKGVNVIAVPRNKQSDVFGGVWMAGVISEPGEKDVRLDVPIHNNKEVMDEVDIKVFERVFNRVVAAYKKAEEIKDPEAKMSAKPKTKPTSKKRQKTSKNKSKRK